MPENEPGKPGHDKALDALQQGMQPHEDDLLEGTPPENLGSSAGASGFVGMLAKGGAGDSQLGGPAIGGGKRTLAEELKMAREVHGGSRVVVKKKARGPVSRWYRPGVPGLLVLATMLLVIGGWALGAMIYMSSVTPETGQSHYPLIAWNDELGDAGEYTAGSRLMAETMLLCLPVGATIGIAAIYMRREMRARGIRK